MSWNKWAETKADFLFVENSAQSYGCRGNPNFLGLEMSYRYRHTNFLTQWPSRKYSKTCQFFHDTETDNEYGFETLGSLFFTSNETQRAVDAFLYLAWNLLESQLSSVETYTWPELSQYPSS
ncbi:hypothetical protein HPG69_014709, partial [Diceros bicornis minor]